ncbi:ROK family glucokinase [Neobacillus rhizophilus]|uniref:Glucokinase n=1 Tax=Neobacillus rhizophilus TaxID=2833579 RepID=A0A942U6L4_9BACI|nr:ROK family glucokinase [Neobacillus rhizophilus]MBS4215661.1 ROK family glucokinase [Neobacillus rhizophilus]MBU8916442.1 ROK family glucokinase [Bacillus sp. FJAT-29953]
MSKKWIVGVDLGGTTTKIAFITMDGDIIHKWEIPTDNSDEGQYITSNIAKSIEEKLLGLNHPKDMLAGVGMGAPGPVDYDTGVILNTVNLGWKDNFPLKDSLEKATSLPAAVENDANCAALGEMWKGAGSGAKNLVCVTLGTGVGGGVISNGNIVQGVNGAAGEIGHITAIPFGGAPCNCGKTGCLETVASATGIVRLALEEIQKDGAKGPLADVYVKNGKITAKDVFDTARTDDKLALSILQEVCIHLGLALANIANLLNPEKIVLGGGVSKAGEILLEPVMENFRRFAFTPVRNSTKLAIANLGNDAGVLGAAWLIRNKLENEKDTLNI